jgi:hypothetical protein
MRGSLEDPSFAASERSMRYRRLRFVALMLAALTLTMEPAHVLELPQKMSYDAALYSAVNTTLYRYFALIGGLLTVLTLVATSALTIVLRGQPEFRWTLAGTLAYYSAFIVWLTVVAPVNSQIAAGIAHAPASVAQLWLNLRTRWEYGHVTGFVLQLAGMASLLWSILRPHPNS